MTSKYVQLDESRRTPSRYYARMCSLSDFRAKHAFSYIEATIGMVILGLGIVTGLSLYASYARGTTIEIEEAIAKQLCSELMEEIMSKNFESGAYASGSFGRAVSELVRADFDDVDDYDGWLEKPIQDVYGNDITDPVYEGYARAVVVTNVDIDNLTTVAMDGSTAAKLIKVVVSKNQKVRAVLACHRTRYQRN